VILIEDTRELQCAAPDTVALRTRPGVVTMADLVRSTLRLRPDRIIVGEVRGGEALDMLKAWNTGHPGGIATVHANSAAPRSTGSSSSSRRRWSRCRGG
jgi:Flp pilus assembly CpaF family ATPase